MASTRVLLIGGHGKVALLLTPHLLNRSWHVTSLIRNPDQKQEILDLGKNHPGKLEVLLDGVEDVQSDEAAQKIIDKAKPNYIVWAAGAGGKGGPSRTKAVDQDAAIHFINSSINTPSITKFLLISYLGSRRNRPSWWNDEDWSSNQHVNQNVLAAYHKAKLAADEHFAKAAKQRTDFQAIDLRPGTLSDDAPAGKVSLGKTSSRGKISRADVADVAARLLERDDTRGWIDLLDGSDDVEKAIDRVVKENIDTIEGE